MSLKAPFPWFGGKSRAAHLVWSAFGDVPNYVEPFAGSLAVLLARPTPPRIETVNDLDCYLANFWRAVQMAPDEVAAAADWPVNEADLHARHRWLVARGEFRQRIRSDPDFFDAKIAGWWVWGLSQWIGSGWCAQPSWEAQAEAGAPKTLGISTSEYEKRPTLDKPGRGVHAKGVSRESLSNASNWEGRTNAGRAARGIHTAQHMQRPDLSGFGGVTGRARDLGSASEWEKRPALHRGGRGVQARRLSEQLPCISGDSGATGRGIHASGVAQKMPKADRGTTSRLQTDGIYAWMHALQERLRRVRVCCGDFERILGPSVTHKIGVTGVLLDPPYSAEAGRDPSIYAEEDLGVAHRARAWAIENGDNPKIRVALCGYEGEHDMPPSWQCVEWKAAGGYAASAGNHENAKRERIWFSPHCDMARKQADLFAAEVANAR